MASSVSAPVAQHHLEPAKATDETSRSSTPSSTSTDHTEASTTTNSDSSSMRGHGDSWFENLTALVVEHRRQKENQNHQREDHQHRKAEEQQRQPLQPEPHYHGQEWFHNYAEQWAEWQNLRMGSAIRKNDFDLDSDDESCELGQ